MGLCAFMNAPLFFFGEVTPGHFFFKLLAQIQRTCVFLGCPVHATHAHVHHPRLTHTRASSLPSSHHRWGRRC